MRIGSRPAQRRDAIRSLRPQPSGELGVVAVGVARARIEPNPTEPRSVSPPSLVPPAVGAVRRVVGRVEVLRRHQTLVVASALGRYERGPRRSSSGATL